MYSHLISFTFFSLTSLFFFFFFNDTATTEIYTLSLHDALPISQAFAALLDLDPNEVHALEYLGWTSLRSGKPAEDRKSTRLNSSHLVISYAVFCLKKKNNDSVLPQETDPDGDRSVQSHNARFSV